MIIKQILMALKSSINDSILPQVFPSAYCPWLKPRAINTLKNLRENTIIYGRLKPLIFVIYSTGDIIFQGILICLEYNEERDPPSIEVTMTSEMENI